MGDLKRLPYRALAVVEPDTVESPLPPYVDNECAACGRLLYLSNTHFDPNGRRWYCTGGRSGFLWLNKCDLHRAHFHFECFKCGAEWVTATVHPDASFVVPS